MSAGSAVSRPRAGSATPWDAIDWARRDIRRALRGVRPRTRGELHGYCKLVLGLDVPTQAQHQLHSAPFDYLCHTFFETGRVRDCVVWANRGGGKTMLGAVATLLDMLFKPGIEIRILGGSMDQSEKMHTYLREMLEEETFCDLLDGRVTGRQVRLTNGSHVEVLAQSEQSVRGHRVQKLRCDEVELFTPEVWQAAQFVTRSAQCGDVFVPGCIEALSTMHRPFGLMNKLVADRTTRRVFRWGLMEVIEHCRPEVRACKDCKLWEECDGKARKARGFFHVEDALQQKHRTDPGAWQAEMLCERPSRSDCVYKDFDTKVHVKRLDAAALHGAIEAGETSGVGVEWIGGMDFGFRSPTVFLWAVRRAGGVVHVFDEHVAGELTIAQHIARIRARHAWFEPAWIGIDPAGYQRHEHLGRSTASLLNDAGFRLRARRSDLSAGIAAVRARIRSADATVSLLIDPRCERLIDALKQYHYPSDKPDDPNPVKDGSDHACDALRYLVVNLDHAVRVMDVRRY